MKIIWILPLLFLLPLLSCAKSAKPDQALSRQQAAVRTMKRWVRSIRKRDTDSFEKCLLEGINRDVFQHKYRDFFFGHVRYHVLATSESDADSSDTLRMDHLRNRYRDQTIYFRAQKIDRRLRTVMTNVRGNVRLVKYIEGPYYDSGWLIKDCHIYDDKTVLTPPPEPDSGPPPPRPPAGGGKTDAE
jgi:hypothetical protein